MGGMQFVLRFFCSDEEPCSAQFVYLIECFAAVDDDADGLSVPQRFLQTLQLQFLTAQWLLL